MKIKSIALNGAELPESVIAELTISELAFLGKVTGGFSPKTAEEAVPGYGDASNTIYDGITGAVFNRFWDDGIQGFLNGDTE